MKVAAFRDIKAYDQALQVIELIQKRADVRELDQITVLLMKSFCLKGQDKLDEAKVVFNEYLQARKALAKKKYLEKVAQARNLNAKIKFQHST